MSSESSSALVNSKRATGVDMSTVYGLSNKPRTMTLDPKQFHVFMKAVANGKN